ncbi:hypothetical protein AUP43_07990, partial [Oceanibaculum pacificum]
MVIDSRVSDLQEILNSLPAEAEAIVIDTTTAGVEAVTELLGSSQDVASLHIISHGTPGGFVLGADQVDSKSLANGKGEAIAAWSTGLASGADVMLYGCDVGQGSAGRDFLSRMAWLTGADIAASSDATGAATLGGDWDLEVQVGAVNMMSALSGNELFAWQGLLEAPEITGAPEKVTLIEPSSINASETVSEYSFSGIVIDDGGEAEVTVIVTVSNAAAGTLEHTEDGSGSTLSFTGTGADATAWLANLTFVAADSATLDGGESVTTNIVIEAEGGGITVDHTLAVTVTPSNDPTLLPDGSMTVDEGDSEAVTAAALTIDDPEVSNGNQSAEQVIYRLLDLPTYGYLTLNGERVGVGSIFSHQDVLDNLLVYHHTETGAQQNDADGFEVSVNDGATPQASSNTATVTININPINQLPTASGSGTVYEGQPEDAQNANTGNGGVTYTPVGLMIEGDDGGDPGDSLTLYITSLPTAGELYYNGTLLDAGDVAGGFMIAWADRNLLTYRHDGRGAQDSTDTGPSTITFTYRVDDSEDSTGDQTMTLSVLEVNDDPEWNESSTLEADIPDDGNYRVTLDETMLEAMDIDSSDDEITFALTELADKGQVWLNGNGLALGATFTMADVRDGRVSFLQTTGAGPGETTEFKFVVLDNALSLRWNAATGEDYERPGGIYDSGTDNRTEFTFVVNLLETAGGGEAGTPPALVGPELQPSTEYLGDNPVAGGSGDTVVDEGGSGILTGAGGMLHYTAGSASADQIVYTVTGFAGDFPGTLEKNVGGDWITLGKYGTFTQADLNDGNIRFSHDGGESFETSFTYSVTAGGLQTPSLEPLAATGSFDIFITPVNDAPTVAGSTENLIAEGATKIITRDMVGIGDPDDETSGGEYDSETTLGDSNWEGDTNYAIDHDSGNPLHFIVTELPEHGVLQWFDGSGWVDITADDVTDARQFSYELLTNDGDSGLRYIHDGLEVRADSFRVSAVDRHGEPSDGDAAISFVITNVNDGPEIAQNPDAEDAPFSDPAAPNNLGGLVSQNNAITVNEGETYQITTADLAAYDPDSSSAQVQYRITSNTGHGQVALSNDGGNTFRILGVGASFSQADVTAGKLYYIHDGSEPPASPDSPYDMFVFTLADGDKELTNREFHINIAGPANDAPEFSDTADGPIEVGENAVSVSGFTIADADLADGVGSGETDFVQAIVRVVTTGGAPIDHATTAGGVTIGYAAGLTPIDGHDGDGDYLVLQGTRAEINAALAGLTVQFGANADTTYRLQVILDDRSRDANGDLTSGANGGPVNDPGEAGGDSVISGTDYDWGSESVADADDLPLPLNMAMAQVTLYASAVNDPGAITGVPVDQTVDEDVRTFIGGGFAFTDAESTAFDLPVTVTISTGGNGTLEVGDPGDVEVSGNDSGTLTLTGTVGDIAALLNDSTDGLHYTSAGNANHDQNAGGDGDVTITVTLTESDAALGSGPYADGLTDSFTLTIDPVNDRPGATASGGALPITNSGFTAVTGLSVSDADISDTGGVLAGETDVVEVTVRLLESNVALGSGDYTDGSTPAVMNTTAAGHGATVDGTYDGDGTALKIRGTIAQVNAYLGGLQIDLGYMSNSDATYAIEIVVDDRVRDVATGALDGSGDANGGPVNQDGDDTPTAIVDTPATIDPFTTAIPADLTPNTNSASRNLFLSTVNNPADVTASDVTVDEGSATIVLSTANSNIQVSDPDHNGGVMSVTVTVDEGFITAVGGTGGTVTGVGASSQEITIEGTQAQINNRLNAITITLPVFDHDTEGSGTAADWNGEISVTVVVNDQGNTGERPGALVGQDDHPDTDDATTGYGDYAYADGSSNELTTTRIFTITVDPVNDAPVIGGDVPTNTDHPDGPGSDYLAVTILETPVGDRTTTQIALLENPTTSDIDFQDATFEGGTLTISFEDYQAGDVLSLDGSPVGVESVTGGEAADLVITLSALADETALPAILAAIRYHSTSATPGGAGADALTRDFSIVLNDGNNDNGVTNAGGPAALDSNILTGTIVIDLPPEAVNDTNSLGKNDDDVDGTVLPNDSDPNGDDGISVTAIAFENDPDNIGTDQTPGTIGNPLAGDYGTLTLNADGTYTYDLDNALPVVETLRPGETLVEVFTYEITDPSGQTDTATLTITINGDSAPPVATDNTAAVAEDVTLTDSGNVITDDDGNDVDYDPEESDVTVAEIEGDSDNVGEAVEGTYGSVVIQANGSYTYTLNNAAANVQALAEGETVTDVFEYTLTDEDGDTATATLTVTITGQNDAPTALNNAHEIDKGETDPITGNVIGDDDGDGEDSDPDNDAVLSIAEVDGVPGDVGQVLTGTYGTITINSNGSYSYTLDNANADVIALRPGQTLTESFDYTLTDEHDATDTATLTITINGVNTGPFATDNSNAITEDDADPVTGNVMTEDDGDGVDSDPEGTDIEVTAIDGESSDVGQAVEGTYGSVTINSDGSYSYALNNASAVVQALTEGQIVTDSFDYTITDEDGGTATATLTITITGVNDTPVAQNNDNSVVKGATDPITGNVIDDDNGDGVDADPDAGTDLTVSAIDGEAGDVGQMLTGTYGTITINSNGSYSYTLDNDNEDVVALRPGDPALTENFTYTIVDDYGQTDTATLTITINGENTGPTATDNENEIDEDATVPATGNVLTDNDGDGVDTDPEGTDLIVAEVNGEAADVGVEVAGTYGAITINEDGSYSYVIDNDNADVQALEEGETVTDSFTYTMQDEDGGTDTATLTITINGVNTGPFATDNSNAITEDDADPVTGNVMTEDDGDGVDSDVEGSDLDVSAVNGETTNVGAAVSGTYGSVTINADGTYSYALDNDSAAVQALEEGETVTDVFTYTIVDDQGATDTATLTVTITGRNDAPVATDNENDIQEDATDPVTGNVISDNDGDGIDSDPEDSPLTVIEIDGESGDVGEEVVGNYGTITINEDGSYSYVIDNDNADVQALEEGETVTDSFTYTIEDEDGATDTATLTITITGVNDAPAAVDDAGDTRRLVKETETGNVLDNDTDIDNGATATVDAVDGEAGNVGSVVTGTYGELTLNSDGSYSYALDSDHPDVVALFGTTDSLTDSFEYTMSDGEGGTASATLTITIT